MDKIQIRYVGPNAAGDDDEQPVADMTQLTGEPDIFFFRAPSIELGTSSVQVSVDGQALPQDPVYVRVTPRICVFNNRVVSSDRCALPGDTQCVCVMQLC